MSKGSLNTSSTTMVSPLGGGDNVDTTMLPSPAQSSVASDFAVPVTPDAAIIGYDQPFGEFMWDAWVNEGECEAGELGLQMFADEGKMVVGDGYQAEGQMPGMGFVENWDLTGTPTTDSFSVTDSLEQGPLSSLWADEGTTDTEPEGLTSMAGDVIMDETMTGMDWLLFGYQMEDAAKQFVSLASIEGYSPSMLSLDIPIECPPSPAVSAIIAAEPLAELGTQVSEDVVLALPPAPPASPPKPTALTATPAVSEKPRVKATKSSIKLADSLIRKKAATSNNQSPSPRRSPSTDDPGHVDDILTVSKNDTTNLFHCPDGSCNRGFSRRFNLKQHYLSTHAGVTNYACGVCGFTFTRKADVKRHTLTQHPKKEVDVRVVGEGEAVMKKGPRIRDGARKRGDAKRGWVLEKELVGERGEEGLERGAKRVRLE